MRQLLSSRSVHSRFALSLCSAAASCLFGASAWADGCKNPKPIPPEVTAFHEKVAATLLASVRIKSEGHRVNEVRVNQPRVRTYCSNDGPVTNEIELRFALFYPSDEVAKAVALIEHQCEKDEREYNKQYHTLSPEKQAEMNVVDSERKALDAKRPSTNSYDPGYKAHYVTYKADYDRFREARTRIENEHRKPWQLKSEERRKQCREEKIKAGAPLTENMSVSIKVNGWEFQEKPQLRFGTAGETKTITTKVQKVDINGPRYDGSLSNAAVVQSLSQLLDLDMLKAMIDGKFASPEAGQAAKAQLDAESKTENALAKQRLALYRSTLRDANEQEQKARTAASTPPRPTQAASPSANSAPSAVATSSPAPAAAENSTAAQAPAPAPAPAPTPARVPAAPALPNSAGQVLDGVNKLKGLFGR